MNTREQTLVVDEYIRIQEQFKDFCALHVIIKHDGAPLCRVFANRVTYIYTYIPLAKNFSILDLASALPSSSFSAYNNTTASLGECIQQ